MTRRSSVRAQARRIYRDSKQASEAADPSSLRGVYHRAGLRPDPLDGQAPTPDPPSLRSGAASLTARVRALYEDSAVPVREIAQIAGVTERTIYKYAAKHAWKPRYRWAPERGWRAKAAFAPAKGAGARFIRREDKGKPFATGLKATDPAAAARALRASGQAARLARAAQAKAEAQQRFEQRIRAIDDTNRAARELNDFLAARKAQGARARTRADDLLAHMLIRAVDVRLGRWEALQAAAMSHRPLGAIGTS